jgi:glutamine cyclotransferase
MRILEHWNVGRLGTADRRIPLFPYSLIPLWWLAPLLSLLLIPVALCSGQAADAQAVTMYTYKVLKAYPHDPQAFTQGLTYENGILYEGTGLRGRSMLIKRELESGKLIKRERLPRKYFGEGITLFGDKLVQLTWKSRTGFVYDKKTFRALDEFKYTDQGWGIVYDGRRLIMSDGTSRLRILDPNTFAVTGRIQVRHQGRNVRGLNEMEIIDGQIYANIWPTEYIAIIAPKTGNVTGWINLTGLCPVPEPRSSNIVLNGIAYRSETRHLLVTGKCWPKLYEIELVPLMPAQP